MPVLKDEIFDKVFITTPQNISPAIASLCRELSPDHSPLRVTVHPASDASAGECFHNVLAKVERDGGAILYGWLIWEWPRVFIEAEHHAVWEINGALVDVTPPVNGEPTVLFLPDPKRIYDYENKKRIINIKRSLGVFPSADRWIIASDAFQNTLEEYSTGDEIQIDRDLLKVILKKSRNAQTALLVELASSTKRNDACFCNSGKKFKKCCARLIDFI